MPEWRIAGGSSVPYFLTARSPRAQGRWTRPGAALRRGVKLIRDACRDRDGDVAPAPKREPPLPSPKLPAAERERQIVEGAIKFFAEVGFSGDTRQLAKRLHITHPLLFRYFPTKDALVERVYETVFLRSWNPYWEQQIENRSLPVRDRMFSFYKSLVATIMNYEWVRLFIFAGLKGSDLNARWFALMRERIYLPLCRELRLENGLPSEDDLPISGMEVEIILGLNARVFNLGVRKFVYGVAAPDDLDGLLKIEIEVFLKGFALAHLTLAEHKPAARKRAPRRSSVTV